PAGTPDRLSGSAVAACLNPHPRDAAPDRDARPPWLRRRCRLEPRPRGAPRPAGTPDRLSGSVVAARLNPQPLDAAPDRSPRPPRRRPRDPPPRGPPPPAGTPARPSGPAVAACLSPPPRDAAPDRSARPRPFLCRRRPLEPSPVGRRTRPGGCRLAGIICSVPPAVTART